MKYYSTLYWGTYNANLLSDKTEYKEWLELTSKYLDNCGLTISAPDYPYDEKDVSTWKYIETKMLSRLEQAQLSDLCGGKLSWTILNPNWKYKDLELKRLSPRKS